MLDIKFIRENKDLVALGAKKKHIEINLDELISLDDKRKEISQSIEKKRSEQNSMNDKIAKATSPEDRQKMIADMKLVKDSALKEEEEFKEVMKKWQTLMVQVPNMPDISVPDGESDKDNKEYTSWGEIPKLAFAPKNHIEIMESLDLADFEKGAEVAGFRGYYLKNDAVLLNFAIWNYVLQEFMKKGEWKPMMVPIMVRKEALLGTGYLPQGEEDLYKTQDGDYLTGTAEVATMSYFADKIFEKKDLPIKVLAFSTCFRREAGSHSKDVKGAIRLHEFYKIEQVIICEANHEASVKHHEELRENSEKILQGLNIPYHVVVNCGGDLGLGQVKKYDIEAWIPGQNRFLETHSCSYFHDFQTRRLNIRYRDDDGKLRFAHSLNNTAVASPRILVPILENYQQADGSVNVPEVLKPFIGKDSIKK